MFLRKRSHRLIHIKAAALICGVLGTEAGCLDRKLKPGATKRHLAVPMKEATSC